MARRSATPRSPATRENIGWPHAPFEVPRAIVCGLARSRPRAAARRAQAWERRLAALADSARPSRTAIAGELPAALVAALDAFRKRACRAGDRRSPRASPREMALERASTPRPT